MEPEPELERLTGKLFLSQVVRHGNCAYELLHNIYDDDVVGLSVMSSMEKTLAKASPSKHVVS